MSTQGSPQQPDNGGTGIHNSDDMAAPQPTPLGAAGGTVIQRTTEQRIVDWVGTYGMVVVLAGVVIAAQILNPGFYEFANIRNILSQNAAVGIVAIGATLVIIGGGFDLSASGLYAFGGVLFATFATGGMPILAAIGFTLAIGAALGLANGVIINSLKVNPLVATLGSGSMISGLAFIVSRSASISALDIDGFDTLGRSRLFDVTYSVYLLIALLLVTSFLLHRTAWGRNVYALGGNREASRLAGMRVQLMSVSTYVLSGVFGVLGGVVIASRTAVGQPNIGATVALEAIAMVIIGGTTLFGGEGAIWRTFVGMMILGILRNLFDALSLSNAAQLLAQGAILVSAVALDALVRERRSR